MTVVSDDFRSLLAVQEAASTAARADAARAAARAEHEAERTNALRRLVKAEERVRAHETAAIERARLYDAVEQALEEQRRHGVRVRELEAELASARKERQRCADRAAAHSAAWDDLRRDGDGDGDARDAQRALRDAKLALAALDAEAGPPGGANALAKQVLNYDPVAGHWTARPVARSPGRAASSAAATPKRSEPHSAPSSGSTPRRRFVKTTLIHPPAYVAAKRRESADADRAAKRARRTAGVVVKAEDDDDPF